MQSNPKFMVVVGTSAGGIRALEELVMQLTPDMDAAFFFCPAPLTQRCRGGVV